MTVFTFNQPNRWRKTWELCSGEQVIATLAITSTWSWRKAEAKIGDKTYTLEFRGWRGNLFALDPSGAKIAETKPRSFWSTTRNLTIIDKHYTITQKKGRMIATDDSGTEIVSVTPRSWTAQVRAELVDSSDEMQVLIALILFYRMKYMRMNNTMAAITASNAAIISSS